MVMKFNNKSVIIDIENPPEYIASTSIVDSAQEIKKRKWKINYKEVLVYSIVITGLITVLSCGIYFQIKYNYISNVLHYYLCKWWGINC